MPELPEVETIKNTISRFLINETIDSVEVYYKRMILSGADDFVIKLQNKKIIDIKRRGKYLLFYLSEDYVILSHLRMEGKFYLLNGDEPISKHTRVLFTFKSGKRVIYDDSRMFGIMKLLKVEDLDEEILLKRVGPEPFEIKDSDYLFKKYSKLTVPIKSSLLNQEIMSGLGNIYADEVLFLSRINPKTPSLLIEKDDASKLLKNSIVTLNKAINLGGSTIKSYHSAQGVDGKFQNELLVYGKENEPCPNCSRLLKKIRVNGRGTTFCPRCQKLKKSCFVIGITGTIASGKSTALKYLRSLGIKTISCDDVVEDLYHDVDICKMIKNTLKREVLNDNGLVNKDLLRIILSSDQKMKNKLEKIIHPLVEDIVYKYILDCHEETVAIEIPLLFEAKMDYLCDYIIALFANEELQAKNLKMRNGNIELRKIYDNSSFATYKKYADEVIEIDEDITHLENKLKAIVETKIPSK